MAEMRLTRWGKGKPGSRQRGLSSPERAGAEGSLWSWVPHLDSGAAHPSPPLLVMQAAPGAPRWVLAEQIRLVSADPRNSQYCVGAEDTS